MLTPAEFAAAAPAVAAAWEAVCDGGCVWRVVPSPAALGAATLGGVLLEVMAREEGDAAPGLPMDGEDVCAVDDDDGGVAVDARRVVAADATALAPPAGLPSRPRLLIHVVHAPCHASPALLVAAAAANGAPLPLSTADAALPALAAAAGAPVPPPPLAPTPHPHGLAGCWGDLHPCAGGALASEVGGAAATPARRLAAWLSFAAPAAGVRAPLGLAGEVERGRGGDACER